MNKNLSRRKLLKTVTVSALSAALFSSIGCKRKDNKDIQENNISKESKDNTIINNNFTVVIAGGGYGGATAAKYLKLLSPDINVILIDRNKEHISCAMSNEVIFNLRKIDEITKPLSTLSSKYGVDFKQAEIIGIDPEKQILKTDSFNIKYDKLIVSPGISMDYNSQWGSQHDIEKNMPHGWIAGKQTLQLQEKVSKIKKGETIILRTPLALYRCPPGPYERACLYGALAKEKGAKVIVLDPNPKIMSKEPLFKAAFEELYKDNLTYIPSCNIKSIDITSNTIISDKGSFTGELINFIPEQKAGELAFTLGLVENGKKWAGVDPKTLKSTLLENVYVIGDAIDSANVGEMPKSGTIANAMAKMVVENIIRERDGLPIKPAFLGNTCYSLVSHNEAIWIATLYEYDSEKNRIITRNGANGIPEKRSVENKQNGHSWGENILYDTFM